MKLILSRKGFDSSAGGVASPILPDGRLLSLPIPDPAAPLSYADLISEDIELGQMAQELSKGRVLPSSRVHLDPDLVASHQPREEGWRPLFGQTGAAEGHLRRHDIQAGDVFLYFGWFREVTQTNGRWDFKRDAQDQHIIYGWLQVSERINLTELKSSPPAWTQNHPHFFGDRGSNNALYLATETLQLPGSTLALPGGGIFPHVQEPLMLTRQGKTRCHWSLPAWFHPEGRASCLSYHDRPSRWQRQPDCVHLHSVARGQEFVLDLDHYPEALPWLKSLFSLVATFE